MIAFAIYQLMRQNRVLVGDIGGTNLRLAIVSNGILSDQKQYNTADHPTVVTAIDDYLSKFQKNQFPKQACIAIAGPIVNQTVQLTNRNSQIILSSQQFSLHLKIPVHFLNDFEAIGFYLYGENLQLMQISKGAQDIISTGNNENQSYLQNDNSINNSNNTKNEKSDNQLKNIANTKSDKPFMYIGAGTGLGVGYAAEGKVFSSEGGHIEIAVESKEEYDILSYLQQYWKVKRISVERIVSGPGLLALTHYYLSLSKQIDKQLPEDNAGQYILDRALELGEKSAYYKALQYFFRQYGRVAGSEALIFLPVKVYISGGILLKDLQFFNYPIIKQQFLKEFYEKGRVSKALEKIPIYAITENEPGLMGCYSWCLQNEYK